jgi:hypothetical protein
LPFVIYADFESISKPCNVNKDESCNVSIAEPVNQTESQTESKTKKLKHQSPAQVGVLIKSDHEDIIPTNYFSYIGEDVVKVFCNFLVKIEDDFSQIFEIDLEMEIKPEAQNEFENTKNCYYCEKELNEDRVRDHDHLTGKYRSAAHKKCNILAKKDKFIPIFFHNLCNYNDHLFIKTLAERIKDHPNWRKRELKLLAMNSEEYISFQFGCLRFLDSYRFLQASLDNATKSMVDGDFKITRNYYPK